MAQKQAVNHLDVFNRQIVKHIDNLKLNITKAANNIPANMTEENSKRTKEFARAQIEVLNQVLKQIPAIKKTTEHLR